ncbi:Protein tyrosine phosphatase type IVA 1 [Rhizophlyctis rosea]|nr:Protein tyrosine phosphatase type IVA 1 [Rhizophlyctis rosea]
MSEVVAVTKPAAPGGDHQPSALQKQLHVPATGVTTGVKMQRQGSAPRDPKLPNAPSLLEYKNMKFLIFDAPSDRNIDLYVKEMKNAGVTDVVRVCEPTYDKSVLEKEGILVHDWAFPDGDPPPSNVVNNWLHLVESRFGGDKREQAIGVHCVAGLGRAPVLVAMALVEKGMQPLDSVIYVRNVRRGAINARQLKWIEGYKRSAKDKACSIQ